MLSIFRLTFFFFFFNFTISKNDQALTKFLYYVDISLLWGKYARMFVQRFPGIPEMLYFPTPTRSNEITDICYILLVKTLEKSVRNFKGNITPDHRGVMSNVVRTVNSPTLVQSGVLSIPKAGNIGFAPQFRTKVARVWIWIKGSRRLWFGIWVLYFHRMLKCHISGP